METRHKAIIALIIANAIWGGASPIFKWSLTNIAPFTLALLRFSLAGLILYPLVTESLKKIDKADLTKILLFGLCGVTFNISFFFLGLRLAPAINAALIATLQPLLLLVLGAVYLKERVEKLEIFGTLVSFTGVLIIIFSPLLINGGLGKSTFQGNLFFFLATLGAIGQAFFGKQLFQKYDSPLPITFLAFFIGSLSFFPFFLYEWLINPSWLSQLSWPGIFGLVYGSVFSSFLAYSFYDFGLSKIEASETGIFTYLIPVVSILLAVVFFGEKITLSFLAGAALVVLGIFMTERRLPHHPLYKSKKN